MRDSTERGVKKKVTAVIHFGIIFFIVACEKDECVGGNLNLSVEHLGGRAYSNQWVLPVKTNVIQSGWWSNTIFEPTGDTVFTDSEGKVAILMNDNIDGFIFQSSEIEIPYFANLALQLPLNCSNSISIALPNFIYFKFIGNRDGHGNDALIINPSDAVSLEKNENWFTPGSSPRPFLLFKDWIHPHESPPFYRSFNFYNSEGTFLFQHQVLIPESALEDTLIIPIP